MKKTATFLTIILVILSLVTPVSARESGFVPDTTEDITAEAIYLYNLDTNSVIYEKNSEEARSPASLTKVMTAILALEHTENLDTEMVKYPLYVQDFLYNYQLEHGFVSTGDLAAGDTLSMREYLYALMLPSANEAALTIANHIGGSQEGFIEMMNAKATELGATQTTFKNPNGLYEDGHLSSAKDMALFTLYAMSFPDFVEIVGTTQYKTTPQNANNANRPELIWDSTNYMQDKNNEAYYYEGLSGVKTGTLEESGRCFISTTSRDGYNYLLVLMGSTFEPGGQIHSFKDAKIIYDWVFDSIRYRPLVPKDKRMTEIPVRLSSDTDFVHLIANEHFTALMPNNIEDSSVTKVYEIPEYLDAPVKANDYVGEVVLIFDNEEIGRVPLVASDSVEASSMLIFMKKAKEITGTLWFKFVIVLLILLILFYIVAIIIRNRNKKRKSQHRNQNRRRR